MAVVVTMASQSPKVSPPRSPPAILFRVPPPAEAPKENAVIRLLITPLTFISFLLSLALIDSRNHSLRTHSHQTPRPTPTTLLGRVKAALHSLVYKRTSASPYAYVNFVDGKDDEGSDGKGEKASADDQWHWHTKQRQMMKAEVSDAFRLRKFVVVLMIAAGVFSVVGTVGVLRWVAQCLLGGVETEPRSRF